MPESLIPRSEIMRLLHENSENSFRHTTYREENQRHYLLMQGDMAAVEEAVRIIDPELQGTLSSDPVRNMRYLVIIGIGLATRFTIEAGVPQETVYSTSDLYIQKADIATTHTEFVEITREFWTKMVEMVQVSRQERTFSKPVMTCLDYIDVHFTSRITLSDLSRETGLHPAYLASLFKTEVGETFGSYLARRRIETAQSLLTRTEYTYSQIAYSLAFCSQSHFTKIFREKTGFTPHQYRMRFYNTNISSALQKPTN